MELKYVVFFIAFLAVGAYLLNGVKNNPIQEPKNISNLSYGVVPGFLAKDFSLDTIEGKHIRLSDFKGSYVLFAAFASWCSPCRIEAERVRDFQESHPEVDLKVIQISEDPRESDEALISFRNSFGRQDWVIGRDNGTIADAYSIRSFDTTLLVNPDGVIVYRDDGYPISESTLEKLLG